MIVSCKCRPAEAEALIKQLKDEGYGYELVPLMDDERPVKIIF